MTRFELGTVSEGTLRTEDLLPAFAGALKGFDENHALVKEAHQVMAEWDGEDDMDAIDDLIREIEDALSECAPPFVYFGSLEGDGADFGFWPNMDALNEARLHIQSERTDGFEFLEYDGVWIHVNDHGNVAVLADNDGEPGDEIWSIV
jgi:hypothetical protein